MASATLTWIASRRSAPLRSCCRRQDSCSGAIRGRGRIGFTGWTTGCDHSNSNFPRSDARLAFAWCGAETTNPIHSGDTLVILATGLGQTAPAAVSGGAASSDPLENSLAVPMLSLGGASLQVTFSGLVPGMVGVYQINAMVPEGVPSGLQIPLVVQQASSASTFMMSVVNP